MIIANARKVRTSDPATFAWSGLRRFQNVEYVAEQIIKAHKLDAKWHKNATKQAQQLRYCLIQAREYFTAAQSVSLATKPNLLYYGTMSLALAEILFKQTGESSLDRARNEHRHHGLTMTVGNPTAQLPLMESAGQLRALPVEIKDERRGTFELWHKSSREHPLAGITTEHPIGGGPTTTRYGLLLSALDVPFPPLPASGITLAECLAGIPLMSEYSLSSGLAPKFVRGRCEQIGWPGEHWRSNLTITFHPSPYNDELLNQIRIPAHFINSVDSNGEPNTGIHVRFRSDWITGATGMPLPPAATIDTRAPRTIAFLLRDR